MNVKQFIKFEFLGWTKLEIIFLFVLIPMVLLVSVLMNDSKIATVSAVFGLMYTIMAGKGKISCYVFGMIGTLCYSFLAWQNAIWGNLILYLAYYFPMEIIGIFAWNKHLEKDTKEIIKTSLNNKERLILGLIIFLFAIIFALILKKFNAQFPFLDSFATVLSIAGMYLTVKRCIEQWIIWTIVNILSVIIWFEIFIQGERTFATLLMWLIYLFLGVYFFIKWKLDMKKQTLC